MAKKNKQPVKPKQSILSVNNIMVLALLSVALIVIGRITFNSMTGNRIVQWDNKTYLYENRLLGPSAPIENLITTPVGGTYSPIPMLILRNEYQRYELNEVNTGKSRTMMISQNPLVNIELNHWPLCDGTEYNLVCIWIHLWNSVLVFIFWFLLLRRNDFLGYAGAFITALSFCVLPAHVETVAWIADGKDQWSTFFSLIALIAYLVSKRIEGPTAKIAWLIVSFISVACALLSKATSVALYPIFILIDYFVYGEALNWRLFVNKGRWILFILCFTAGVFAITGQSQVKAFDVVHYTLAERVFFSGYALLNYLLLWLVPDDGFLCIVHLYPEKNWLLYASPFVAIALIGSFVWRFRKNRLVLFCVFFFLFSIAPLLQLVSFNRYIIAERYTYFSFIGLSGLTSLFVCWCWKKLADHGWIAKSAVVIISVAYFLWSADSCVNQGQAWFDNKTLWGDVAKKYPAARYHYSEPYYEIGASYTYELGGNTDSALYYLNLCNQVSPNTDAYLSLGQLAICDGKVTKSISYFKKCVETDSTHIDGYEELAVSYIMSQSIDSAQRDIAEVIKRGVPQQAAGSCVKFALTYKGIGRTDSALSLFHRALQLDPNNEYALTELAKVNPVVTSGK